MAVVLSATGSDGAQYRFAEGTRLTFGNNSYLDSVEIGGGDPALTVDVPVGSHSVQLFDPSGRSDRFALTRTAADGSEPALEATLEPVPPFTISADATTELVLHLHAAVGGDITFARGQLGVTIDVDVAAATRFRIDVTAHVRTTTSTFTDAAPPELADLLAGVDSEHDLAVSLLTVGAWQPSGPRTACAPVQISAPMEPQLLDFFNQARLASADSPTVRSGRSASSSASPRAPSSPSTRSRSGPR